MNFNRVEKVLGEKREVFQRYMEIVENIKGVPLIGAINLFLEDSNSHLETIEDKNVEGLVNLVVRLSGDVARIITANDKIHKTIEKMERPFYKMRVSGRVRVATEREIKEGATGLFAEKRYAIQDAEKRKLFWLLAWAGSGYDYYFYKIGKPFQKDVVHMKLYTQIVNAAKEINDLLVWASQDEFMQEFDKIKKFTKEKYQYPDYEADEVVDELTRKQVIYMLDGSMPRGTEDKECRKAISLIIKEKTNKFYTIPPEEVAQLRILYKKIEENKPKSLRDDQKPVEVNIRLKDDCEFLIKARDQGVLGKGEFVFKVINTCMEKNYICRVSEKQSNVIRDAIQKVDRLIEKKYAESEKSGVSVLDKLVQEMHSRKEDEESRKQQREDKSAQDEEVIPIGEISEEEMQEIDRVYDEYGMGEDLDDFSSALGSGFK